MISRLVLIAASLLLLITGNYAQDGTGELSDFISNPTSAVEIRFQTLSSDTTIYHGNYQFFYNGKPMVIGQYVNNYKHGQWRRVYPNGQINIRANFNEGWKHGAWSTFYPDGQLASSMMYSYDRPTGHWKGYNREGVLIEERIYAADSVLDTHILYHFNGTKAAETKYSYSQGNTFKVKREWYAHGNKFTEAYYKNDQLDSVYRLHHSNGVIWEELLYDEGKLMEVSKMKAPNGNPMDPGPFAEGAGKLKQYNADGSIYKVSHYNAGKLDGEVVFYQEKTPRVKGQYQQGERAGLWEFLNEKSAITERWTYTFKKDSVITETLTPKGTVVTRFTYVDGLLNGPYLVFGLKGDTARVFQYSNGLKHGQASFYEKGKLTEQGTYEYGERKGKWKHFGANGRVFLEEDFNVQGSYLPSENKQKAFYTDPERVTKHSFYPYHLSATFLGGDYAEDVYVTRSMLYPRWAEEQSVHGTVNIELRVSVLGEVLEIRVIKGIGYHCDDEAIAVFGAIPFWQPALQNGFLVESTFVRSINF